MRPATWQEPRAQVGRPSRSLAIMFHSSVARPRPRWRFTRSRDPSFTASSPIVSASRRTGRVIVSAVRGATNGEWTADELASLTRDFADVFSDRTVLVTGADGFMGSHLTEALVHLGARVHAFVRATSSGGLNNLVQLRRQLSVHFADLTDRASVDYLVGELGEAPDKPYIFHLGA